jgi:hypothetical protein
MHLSDNEVVGDGWEFGQNCAGLPAPLCSFHHGTPASNVADVVQMVATGR